MAKSKYSKGQQQAYYSGMGYRVAYEGKRIDFKSPDRQKSFTEGYKKSGSTITKYPKKYPKWKKDPSWAKK